MPEEEKLQCRQMNSLLWDAKSRDGRVWQVVNYMGQWCYLVWGGNSIESGAKDPGWTAEDALAHAEMLHEDTWDVE